MMVHTVQQNARGRWFGGCLLLVGCLVMAGIVPSFAADGQAWPPPLPDGESSVARDLTARNFMVVLDGSGSMLASRCSGNKAKIEVAKAALMQFADRIPSGANLGLVAFDESGVMERMALASGKQAEFKNAVMAVRPFGDTPLRSAIAKAAAILEKQGAKQLGYGEYHLVVVTDGEASWGEDPSKQVERLLQQTPIVIHTVGFCIGTNHTLNQPGRTLYKAANNPDELMGGLDRVLSESETFRAMVDRGRFGAGTR